MPAHIMVSIIILSKIFIDLIVPINNVKTLAIRISSTHACCIKHIGQGFQPKIIIV